MISTFKSLSFIASAAVCSLIAGCGTGSDDNGNTGGASGTTGGNGPTAGSSSTGGNGAGGVGNGVTKLFSFNTDHEGFMLETSASGNVQYRNLAKPAADPAPMVGFASTKDYGNDPSSGSLLVTATYSFWNQSVSAEVTAPVDKTGAPIDFTGKTVKAEIWVDGGLSPAVDAPGGVVFYMKSGQNYDWGQAPWKNIEVYKNWIQVKFNADALDPGSKETFSPADVRTIGFQISSGGGGTNCPDTDTSNAANKDFVGDPTDTCPAWLEPLPTTVYIDSITVENNE